LHGHYVCLTWLRIYVVGEANASFISSLTDAAPRLLYTSSHLNCILPNMHSLAKLLPSLPFISLALAQHMVPNPEHACASIAHAFHYENVKVNFAEYVPANTNLSLPNSGAVATCQTPYQEVPVDICRVAMFVKTSATSNITLEAWLPTNWTGRFLSTGNGGLDGCIQYVDIAYANSFGFAAVGANNGHNGTSGKPFYHNPEVVTDFAWRSMHTGVVVGKALTKAYYERDYTKSYYLGCSTGGREGFKMVQDFPEDFDGAVIGAPALAFNNLSSWSGSFLIKTGYNDSATWLTPDEWVTVHEDILAQCDTLDGAADGMISDTLDCHYDPVNLICAPGNTSSSCLSTAKVNTVKKVFEPVCHPQGTKLRCAYRLEQMLIFRLLFQYYGVNGSLIYPRMQPGSELEAAYIYYTGQPFPVSEILKADIESGDIPRTLFWQCLSTIAII